MVYSECNNKYLTSVKHNATQIEAKSSKTLQSSSSSGSSWSSNAANADKYKYNNMVKDNREAFNGMHFS